MTEDLLQTIQETLRRRWEKKLTRILDHARNFASAASGRLHVPVDRVGVEKAIREAYTAGYREGYWEGVIDVVECGALHDHHVTARTDPAVLVH